MEVGNGGSSMPSWLWNGGSRSPDDSSFQHSATNESNVDWTPLPYHSNSDTASLAPPLPMNPAVGSQPMIPTHENQALKAQARAYALSSSPKVKKKRRRGESKSLTLERPQPSTQTLSESAICFDEASNDDSLGRILGDCWHTDSQFPLGQSWLPPETKSLIAPTSPTKTATATQHKNPESEPPTGASCQVQQSEPMTTRESTQQSLPPQPPRNQQLVPTLVQKPGAVMPPKSVATTHSVPPVAAAPVAPNHSATFTAPANHSALTAHFAAPPKAVPTTHVPPILPPMTMKTPTHVPPILPHPCAIAPPLPATGHLHYQQLQQRLEQQRWQLQYNQWLLHHYGAYLQQQQQQQQQQNPVIWPLQPPYPAIYPHLPPPPPAAAATGPAVLRPRVPRAAPLRKAPVATVCMVDNSWWPNEDEDDDDDDDDEEFELNVLEDDDEEDHDENEVMSRFQRACGQLHASPSPWIGRDLNLTDSASLGSLDEFQQELQEEVGWLVDDWDLPQQQPQPAPTLSPPPPSSPLPPGEGDSGSLAVWRDPRPFSRRCPDGITSSAFDNSANLRTLLQVHYQLLVQQMVLSVRAAQDQNQRQQDHGEDQQDTLDSSPGATASSPEELLEIVDAAVKMLQDLDHYRKDAIRRAIQFSSLRFTRGQCAAATEGPDMPAVSDHGQARRLTRLQFTKTLKDDALVGSRQTTVFGIPGLRNLDDTFSIIDHSVDGLASGRNNLLECRSVSVGPFVVNAPAFCPALLKHIDTHRTRKLAFRYLTSRGCSFSQPGFQAPTTCHNAFATRLEYNVTATTNAMAQRVSKWPVPMICSLLGEKTIWYCVGRP
jgi:hypothetical protein